MPSGRLRSSLAGFGFLLLLLLAGYGEWLGWKAARDFPPVGSFARVGDVTLHYRELRPQQGSKGTIVLLHGAWYGHADLLATLGPRLSEHRVIAVDRPGQGWSDRPGGWAMASPVSQAEAVMAWLDTAAPERLVLVAHSLAGPMALRIALERPDRVAGVVLLGAVTHPWLGEAARYHAPLTSPVLGPVINLPVGIPLTDLAMRRLATLAFSPRALPPDFIETSELPLLLRESALRSNLQDIVATDRFLAEQVPRYRQLRVPVVAIVGDGDAFVSPLRHSLAISREAPMVRLDVMAGVGHIPHHADPEKVAQAAAAFAGSR